MAIMDNLEKKTLLDAADEMTLLTKGDPDVPCCRFCNNPLRQTFVDLGMSPLCESYLSASQLNQMEPFYPLHVRVCGKCFLVQLRGIRQPGKHLHRVRVLLLLFRQLAGARQGLYRADGQAASI